MAGTLDKVNRVDWKELVIDEKLLFRGSAFEFTIIDSDILNQISNEIVIDCCLIKKRAKIPGWIIIEAAGNLGYPMGLRIERIAAEI